MITIIVMITRVITIKLIKIKIMLIIIMSQGHQTYHV